MSGWEGVIIQPSQETCQLPPGNFKLSGRKALIMRLKKIVQIVILLAICSMVSAGLAKAQELPKEQLKTIEIVGKKLSTFAIGSQTFEFDSTLITLNALSSLADLVGNYSAIAVKSYGNGMLSSISFRGTGPGHAAVLWHGINIAYPMLGQSDLSLLSLALNDAVSIQYGTGAALYGSGALGGTLSLQSSIPNPGTTFAVSQWAGSFGSIKNQLQASFATDKAYIKVKTLWDQAENDFKFINTTRPGTPLETQKGADYKRFGTDLESGLFIGEHSQLLVATQYLGANRNLQPSMNVNVPTDNQLDQNIRTRTEYNYKGTAIDLSLSYTFLHDVIGFNGDETFADQQVIRIETEYNLRPGLKLSLAGDYNFIHINSPFYATANTREKRANIWASFLAIPLKRLLLSVNLRQSFNANYKIPFTPSLGAEYLVLNKANHQLRLKTQLAKGFRVPTLNERFWVPGGNIKLIPEESFSTEFGIEGRYDEAVSFTYALTGYKMWVDNWILWLPQGSFWSPENIRKVNVYGLEVTASLTHEAGAAQIQWMANYAWTKSINRTGLDQYDRSVGKQLAYVPVHKASLTAIAGLKQWSVLVNTVYTGQRYVTADNESSLPGYVLLNFKLSKSFKLGKYLLSGHANINNVLNSQYQSIENKAMPGINYLLGISASYYKP